LNKKRSGLGRGLGSLIQQLPDEPGQGEPDASQQPQLLIPPESTDTLTATGVVDIPVVPTSGAGLFEVPIESISPNPHQPRQGMNVDMLEELAYSIKLHGVLQPLVVTDTGGGTYALIAGERRWRAARLAGLDVVPVIVKEVTSSEMLELALVENLQRSDLNPIEEASAFKALVEDFGLRQEDIAARVGKSRSSVSNSLRLLTLPPEVQESLLLGLIEAGHARAILQVPDAQGQMTLLHHTVADGLSVRQVEALARRMAEAAGHIELPARPTAPIDEALFNELRSLEDRFRAALGTKVQLSRSSRGGRLVIYFYSEEELDRIYGTIVGEEE
jgi:ParB family chromosome partitioning protein